MSYESVAVSLDEQTLLSDEIEDSSEHIIIIDSSLFWNYLKLLTGLLTIFFVSVFVFITLYDFDKDTSNFERRRKIEIQK